MPSVVTANILRSGAVVYLAAAGHWVSDLREALVVTDADGLKALEISAGASVERSEVTAVYAFNVRVTDGKPHPISVREHIRAALATVA
jgi:hypothetical protein